MQNGKSQNIREVLWTRTIKFGHIYSESNGRFLLQ